MTPPIAVNFVQSHAINSCAAACSEAVEKVCNEMNKAQSSPQNPIDFLDLSDRRLKITPWKQPAEGCQKSCADSYSRNPNLYRTEMRDLIQQAGALQTSGYVYSVPFSSEIGREGAAIAISLIQKNPDQCNPTDPNTYPSQKRRYIPTRHFRWAYQYWDPATNGDRTPINEPPTRKFPIREQPAFFNIYAARQQARSLPLTGEVVIDKARQTSFKDSILNGLRVFGNTLGIQSTYLLGSGAQGASVGTAAISPLPVAR